MRRRYALEPSRTYLLTLCFAEGWELKDGYSFDVEATVSYRCAE